MAISRNPQTIDNASWYYENGASIDLIIHTRQAWKGTISGSRKGTVRSTVDDGFIHVRIPSKMLAATLERQGKIETRRKK